MFFGMCVFPRKINNQFKDLTVFQGKVAIFIGRETKTPHFTTDNQRNHFLSQGSSSQNTIFDKMITDLTCCSLNFFELI